MRGQLLDLCGKALLQPYEQHHFNRRTLFSEGCGCVGWKARKARVILPSGFRTKSKHKATYGHRGDRSRVRAIRLKRPWGWASGLCSAAMKSLSLPEVLHWDANRVIQDAGVCWLLLCVSGLFSMTFLFIVNLQEEGTAFQNTGRNFSSSTRSFMVLIFYRLQREKCWYKHFKCFRHFICNLFILFL